MPGRLAQQGDENEERGHGQKPQQVELVFARGTRRPWVGFSEEPPMPARLAQQEDENGYFVISTEGRDLIPSIT